jgi:hypothetical protein
MPHLTQEGAQSTLLAATSPHVTVNAILGLPFIQQTCMIIDAAEQIAEPHSLYLPPFAINFCRAMCTVPPLGKAPNASHFSGVIAEIENLEQYVLGKQPGSPAPPALLSTKSRSLSTVLTSMYLLTPPFEDTVLTFLLHFWAMLLLSMVLLSPISMRMRVLVTTSANIFLSQHESVAPA